MKEENRKINIKLELESGDEAMKEAEVLMEKGLYRGAISRTYYFIFHYVKALLYSVGLEPKTHEGTTHLLNIHFIREGKIEPRFGKCFSRLQKYRQQSDYEPAVVFTKEDAEEELQMAREFSAAIWDLLRNLLP